MKNVVVIGGGHGLSTILEGIKNIEDINISAIVTVADDGGSTGRIRKYYSIPAMGDIRNVMLTLSDSDEILQELMDYRFEGRDNNDISGHSLGNLILTALTNISGSFDEAIRILSDVLKIKGSIIPSTLQYTSLYATMDDGTMVKGENNIPNLIHNIDTVFYKDKVRANPKAIEAIDNADLIIYGIGSLYTSILPNTIIKGISKALKNTRAKKVYLVNCMTQSNETYNYDLQDHIDAIDKHDTPVDLVVIHNNEIPKEILDRYARSNSIEVKNNNNCNKQILEYDLLKYENGLVRHDSNKIKKLVESLL